MTAAQSTVRWNRQALHLLWTIPVATIPAFLFYMVGGFELCGISGCSGGGFGRYTDDQWMSWICCGIIGALYFLSLVFVRWVRPLQLRIALSAALGSVIGGLVALAYWSALPHG